MKRNKKHRNNLKTLLMLIFFIIFIVSSFQIGRYVISTIKSKAQAEELANKVISYEEKDTENMPEENELNEDSSIPKSIDFETLKKQNNEVVAWLYLPDTPINYPVTHTTDNEKYLRKNLDLKYSNEGTLFIDTDNNANFEDINTIIFGHNMKNNAMFNAITKYAEKGFYEEHKTMYLYTPEARYKINFVMGATVNTENSIYNIKNLSQREKVLSELKKKSIFTSEEIISENDKMITLSTCSYEFQNARYVLIGKLIEW